MKEWEYKVVDVLDQDDINDSLNELGIKGWELVSVIPSPKEKLVTFSNGGQSYMKQTRYFFKRG